MPAPYLAQLPKSRSAEEFELMCCDILQKRCGMYFQQYGRNGQQQNGIDLYAPASLGNGYYIAAQCKNYFGNSNPSALISKIKADLVSVSQQTMLPIQKFYIMTSFNRDVQIQNAIIELQSSSPFELEVMFWEDIQSCMASNPPLLAKYYPFFVGEDNLVTLFNLAFIGVQFSSLIFTLLGDRGETDRFCELLQNGAAWIRNPHTKQRFLDLLNGVYKFVNGDLPCDILENYRTSNEYYWCTEIEKIVSTVGENLEPTPRTLFLIGTKLGYYCKLLDDNNEVVIPVNEKKSFMDLCRSFGFTCEQNQVIETSLEPIFLSHSNLDDALPSESYAFISRRIVAPYSAYEHIHNLLMRP